jgi:hypothetical protein
MGESWLSAAATCGPSACAADAIERPVGEVGLVLPVQPGQRPRPARLRARAAAKQIGRDPEQPRAGIVTGVIDAAARVESDPKRLGGGDILACGAGTADAVAVDPRPMTIEDLGKPGRITPGGSDDRPVAHARPDCLCAMRYCTTHQTS